MIEEEQRASDDGSEPVDESARLHAENVRLRRLVGPDEQSYQELRAELADAAEAVRAAEAANGELRGEIMELTVALGQARHNMGKISRIAVQRARRVAGRFVRPIRRRLNDRRA